MPKINYSCVQSSDCTVQVIYRHAVSYCNCSLFTPYFVVTSQNNDMRKAVYAFARLNTRLPDANWDALVINGLGHGNAETLSIESLSRKIMCSTVVMVVTRFTYEM